MPDVDRPVPVPDADDEFFWASLRQRLVLPVCDDCGHVWLRPIPACPQCGSVSIRTRPQEGSGTIYTWVVVNRALDPAFADDAPYTVVTVDLVSGARMVGRLLGSDVPVAGMPVELEMWQSGRQWVPGFRAEPEKQR